MLELDIHRLLDGEFVVWRRPTLNNVFLAGHSPRPRQRTKDENDIRSWHWSALKDIAWVAAPQWPENRDPDLSHTPQTPDCRLLTLADFMPAFPDTPLNPGTPTYDQLVPILDRGVDGIMTDRPAQVRPLIDAWIGRA